MQSPITTHDWKPTHPTRPDDIIEAEKDAAQAWQAVDEWLEAHPTFESRQNGFWREHERRQAQATAAQEWLEDLRALHLNCTCDPDPRRESAVCPAFRAVNHTEEIPY